MARGVSFLGGKARGRAWLALALLVALFLALQVIAGGVLRGIRVDLTENNLYTLSEGTKRVLANLNQDIRFTFYFSDEAATGYPQLKAYARRVEDLLKQYRALSNGRLSLDVIDPEPFSETEDEAVAAGLSGARTAGGETIYFGLIATDQADGREVIGYFAPEREATLEYDLTKLLYDMTRTAKPVLGIVTDLPMTFGPGGVQAAVQGRAEPYVIYDQLRQLFNVRMLGAEFDRIDADVDVLMLAHASGLGPRQHYAIDQYVLRGGKALVLVDPYSETAAMMAQPSGPMGMPQHGGPAAKSDLAPLFKAWGIAFDPDKVVADLALAQRVNMGAQAHGGRQIVDYVAWLGLGAAQIADDDIITAQLTDITLASAGALAFDAAAEGITPLLTSSNMAMLINAAEVAGRPDPDALIRALEPTGETYALAARIRRPASTAFADGPPPPAHDHADEAHTDTDSDADADATPLPDHIAGSDGPINVIIVADADILEDRFWAQVQNFFGERVAVPVADNGRFIINAVDNLAGSDALISLRSRGVSSRPFSLVEDIRREAEARYLREEERLENELRAAEARLAELEGGGADAGDDALLTPEQLAEIERFRAQAVETRQALRAVQRNLRRDIDQLEAWVRGINIALVPVILVLIGLWRVTRRRRTA